MSLLQLRVFASDLVLPQPNFILSERVPLSDSFRREMQDWCNEFFGMHEVAYIFDPQALGLMMASSGPRVVVSHKALDAIREEQK